MSQSAAPPNTDQFKRLWTFQTGKCALCDARMPAHRFEVAHSTLWKKWRPTFDHIVPKSKGGSDEPENLQLAHAKCNLRKGNCFSH